LSVTAARTSRNLAAALILLSGLSHISQLWFSPLGSTALLTALSGVFYLLIGLGLAGQSRFTLWLAIVIPSLGLSAGVLRYQNYEPKLTTLVHVTINLLVVALCAYTLYCSRQQGEVAEKHV